MNGGKSMKRKCLAVGIILLLIGITGIPSTAEVMQKDDTTPPVTTCTLDPPDPDGENGWYVNDVTVTLNATDNESGVNITKYRTTDAPSWQIYTKPFTLTKDGDDILIEYFSIDNAGNTEPVKNATVNIDQTKPSILLDYTWGGDPWRGYTIFFTAICNDTGSGMEKVEFYFNEMLQTTVTGPGPEYVWVSYFSWLWVRGLIWHPQITDEYVKFYALIVIISIDLSSLDTICSCAYDTAGNREYYWIYPCRPASVEPGVYLFKNITLPNNYTGHVGRFFVNATFYEKVR
jgi:hypothetical protein